MKIWLQRAALVGATLFIALLLAEVVVRMTVRVPRGTPYVMENPDTVYYNKPNVSGHHISPGEFDCVFHTNSRGFRSPELGAKAPTVPRILCLGDSFTFGIGVNDSESWPAVTGAMLADSGHRNEIANGGVMGWGLAEYWVWTTLHAAEVQPDLIVIGCHASDWENAANGLVSLEADGSLQRHQVVRKDVSRLKSIADNIPLYDTLATHSALAALVKQTVVRITNKGTTGSAPPPGAGSSEAKPSELDRILPIDKALVDALRKASEAAHAGLLIVFIPSHGEMRPEGDHNPDYRRFRELMQQWTRESGIAYLDTTPLLQDHLKKHGLPITALFHVSDGHCTPAGYRLIASGVSDAILRHPEWLSRTATAPH